MQTATKAMSPEEKRLSRMIEVYATRARLAWNLPADVEDDLRSCGRVSLSEARARFTASRGVAFTTYAEHWIGGGIKRGARNLARTLRQGKRFAEDATRHGSQWANAIEMFDDLAVGSLGRESSAQEEGETPEETMLREERWKQVRAAFAAQSEDDQAILQACVIENANHTELGSQLGINKSTVTRRKQEATDRLIKTFRRLEQGRPLRGA